MAVATKTSGIMGLNSRNAELIKAYNPRDAIMLVKSKIRFKRVLQRANIATPELIDVVATFRDMANIPWAKLEGRSFVIKPDRGSGGSGILVLKWSRKRKLWLSSGVEYDRDNIKRHVRDIIDGQYSAKNLPDRAFFEGLVQTYAKFFGALTVGGLPDIRVIVFNKVPLMAMVRFPTVASGGKANLHAGGVGVGIDIATGVTTYAVQHDQLIAIHPDTAVRFGELKVPRWGKVLETAVETQIASGLGYCGVDIVIDQHGHVMVLEANAHPGLSIQIANMAGMYDRVMRVRNLKVRSIAHGIRISQELFGEIDLHRIHTRQRPVVKRVQEIIVSNPNRPDKEMAVQAKMDTGAWNSSISTEVAIKLGYKKLIEQLKAKDLFRTMLPAEARKLHAKLMVDEGFRERLGAVQIGVILSNNGATVRVFVPVKFQINNVLITSLATVADRKSMQLTYPVIIGSTDLQGFYVDTLQSSKAS